MARTRHLISRHGRRTWTRPLLLIIVLVLLGHAVMLQWLASHVFQPPSALARMADPMFTRVLVAQAPPQPPAAARPAAKPARPSRPAIRQVPEPAAAVEPAAAAAAEAPASAASAPAAAAIERAEAPASAASVAGVGEAAASAVPTPAQSPLAESPAPAASSAATGGSDATDRWPRDTRLSYDLTGHFRGPLGGSAQVQWQREGAHYQVRVLLDITLAGTRVMTSQGEVTADGLRPRVYEETRGSTRRVVRMEGSQLVFDNGRTAPRPEGVQDTASQFVELGWRFANGAQDLRVGQSVQLWLARPGGVDLWTYDVVQQETLFTRHHGDVPAFRLRPRPLANPRGNITAEIWYAPSLQYLPVRIRVAMGQEAWVDLMVDMIEQR